MRTRAGDVARRLDDRAERADIWIDRARARVGIDGEREPAARVPEPDHGSIAAWTGYSVALHDRVVLAENPLPGADVRAVANAAQRHRRLGMRGVRARLGSRHVGFGSRRGTIIDRRLVGQRTYRQVGDDVAAPSRTPAAIAGNLADHDRVQVPFLENRDQFADAAALRNQQHPLLRFGEQNFVRRQRRLAQWYLVEVELDAHAAARCHLTRR